MGNNNTTQQKIEIENAISVQENQEILNKVQNLDQEEQQQNQQENNEPTQLQNSENDLKSENKIKEEEDVEQQEFYQNLQQEQKQEEISSNIQEEEQTESQMHETSIETQQQLLKIPNSEKVIEFQKLLEDLKQKIELSSNQTNQLTNELQCTSDTLQKENLSLRHKLEVLQQQLEEEQQINEQNSKLNDELNDTIMHLQTTWFKNLEEKLDGLEKKIQESYKIDQKSVISIQQFTELENYVKMQEMKLSEFESFKNEKNHIKSEISKLRSDLCKHQGILDKSKDFVDSYESYKTILQDIISVHKDAMLATEEDSGKENTPKNSNYSNTHSSCTPKKKIAKHHKDSQNISKKRKNKKNYY